MTALLAPIRTPRHIPGRRRRSGAQRGARAWVPGSGFARPGNVERASNGPPSNARLAKPPCPRWDYARRMTKAMELLRDDRLDALLDVEIAFEDFPARAPEIFAKDAKGLGVVVRY